MGALAGVFKYLKKYKESKDLYFQIYIKRKKVLGMDHPDTLISMHNLANALGTLGRHKEAEEMYYQTFKRRARVLGMDHPDTLQSMDSYGIALGRLRKYKESEEIHRQAFKQMERVLGMDHPDTLQSMERVLGKYHVSTLRIMDNFAIALEVSGKYEESEKLHREAIKLKEEAFGKDDPETRISQDYLASCLLARERSRYSSIK
jgi:tetratricopeptide (TPR) repeat protein